jgi:hypothetical protein
LGKIEANLNFVRNFLSLVLVVPGVEDVVFVGSVIFGSGL